MGKTNKEIMLDCMEQTMNQKRVDLFDEYYSADCMVHGMPYVGSGIRIDDLNTPGRHTIVDVAPGGPADGKLQLGDELLSVSDGQTTWSTFEELKTGDWHFGAVGSPQVYRVRRGGEEQEVTVLRGWIKGFDVPLSGIKEQMLHFLRDECPDFRFDTQMALEDGDMVMLYGFNSGTMPPNQKHIVFPSCDIYRLRDGKIVEMWSVEDGLLRYTQQGYQLVAPVKAAELDTLPPGA